MRRIRCSMQKDPLLPKRLSNIFEAIKNDFDDDLEVFSTSYGTYTHFTKLYVPLSKKYRNLFESKGVDFVDILSYVVFNKYADMPYEKYVKESVLGEEYDKIGNIFTEDEKLKYIEFVKSKFNGVTVECPFKLARFEGVLCRQYCNNEYNDKLPF